VVVLLLLCLVIVVPEAPAPSPAPSIVCGRSRGVSQCAGRGSCCEAGPCFLPCCHLACRHAYLSCALLTTCLASQILVHRFSTKAHITREDARTEFAHYTRFCPKDTKVGKAVDYATSWIYGCPKPDHLQLPQESLASSGRKREREEAHEGGGV
jgi:hypothetical protein